MLTAVLAGLGLGLGLFVAAQVGPVSLLCVRTVLRHGLAPGLAVGLVWMGARTLWTAHRVRLGLETAAEVTTARAAQRTSLLATASNPLTIASWASIFAAASTAALTSSAATSLSLLAGLGVGSIGWFTVLAGSVALARRRIGDRPLQAVDAVSGAGLVAFGGLLAVRTVRDG